MNPSEKEKLDAQARLHQMQINTRLTALQVVKDLMSTRGFLPAEGGNEASRVDAITVIAMATEIEHYILGKIEAETQAALDEMNKPRPTIVPAKSLPVRP